MSDERLVLGIETSCDETGVAIISDRRGLLAQALFSQVDLHATYGGVVPELASRDHVRRLLPLLRTVLDDAGVDPRRLDAIAYTAGPGLIGALLVGAATAEALAFGWGLPTIPVHHLEGHLMAPQIDDPGLAFPFLVLLVSGGHTQFLDAEALGRYQLLGESIDDAAGEAFDKTAQLLGLGYPGGPALSKLAERGDAEGLRLPRPMCDRPGLDMSFSGLKTAVRLAVESGRHRAEDVAAAFERAVVDVLVEKLHRAVVASGRTQVVVAGGVAANRPLRQALQALAERDGFRIFFPAAALCTDNGVMIAAAGMARLLQAQTKTTAKIGREVDGMGHRIQVFPRWPLSELSV